MRAKEMTAAAAKLSTSPLGIIALFIVLVYAMASLVTAFGDKPSVPVLVWFLALFHAWCLGCSRG